VHLTSSESEDARSLLRRARAALQAGQIDQSLRELESAYEIAVATSDRVTEAEALVHLAKALEQKGSLDQAVLCTERAIEAAKRSGSPRVEAEALVREAEIRRRIGDLTRARLRYEDASKLLDQAYANAKSTGDVDGALDLAERARTVRDALVQVSGRGRDTTSKEEAVRHDVAEVGRRGEEKRRAGEERKRERATLQTLFDVSRRLVEERDPDRVVSAVLDGAIEATGAERGFVLLSPDEDAEKAAQETKSDSGRVSDMGPVERGGSGRLAPQESDEERKKRELPGGLRVSAARNFDKAEVRRPEFKVSRGAIEKALAQGKPVLVRDAALDHELGERSSVLEARLRSIACIPFRSQRPGGVQGVLYLDNRFTEGAFSDEDLPALAAFAAFAAVAVENARLHAQAARERRALERARARAEELAKRLEAELAKTGDELGKARARFEETNANLAARSGYGDIIGRSHTMQSLYKLMDKVKESDVPCLIRGESGTGKELVARAVHFEGARKKGPYVSENCAAIPETLLEAELFGHEAGAFTGAVKRRAGLFELASGGTLFLDEVGELTPGCQAKLLRVLEERRVRRIGGHDTIPVDVRIVCATNRDLEHMVRDGTFREDLYFRLNVVALRLPPLRERRDDIPLLIERFFVKNEGRLEISADALRQILNHAWPGNVRELENEVKRLLALRPGLVKIDDLSPEVRRGAAGPAPAGTSSGAGPAGEDAPPVTLDEAERRAVLAALKAARGNKARAAEILAIPRTSLYHKLRRFKIDDEEFSPDGTLPPEPMPPE
jgi:transcriptional regulator with GAF, ATPase, and Fis domain